MPAKTALATHTLVAPWDETVVAISSTSEVQPSHVIHGFYGEFSQRDLH